MGDPWAVGSEDFFRRFSCWPIIILKMAKSVKKKNCLEARTWKWS